MGLKLEQLPDPDVMVRNIVGAYYTASKQDKKNGRSWYPNTLRYCQTVADEFGLDVERVVAAYAIISPSLDKEKNDEQIRLACDAYAHGLLPEEWPTIGVYGMNNRKKAYRALDGDLSAVSGPKVTAFFQNIMGRPENPTIDRWAIRVAMNQPYLPEQQAIPGGMRVQRAIARAYVEAAKHVRQKPCVVQSVTWENFRNTYYAATAPNGKGRTRKMRELKDSDQYEKQRKEKGIQ